MIKGSIHHKDTILGNVDALNNRASSTGSKNAPN